MFQKPLDYAIYKRSSVVPHFPSVFGKGWRSLVSLLIFGKADVIFYTSLLVQSYPRDL